MRGRRKRQKRGAAVISRWRLWIEGHGMRMDHGRQIEASRVAITRFIKRGGKLWIRIFPDKPFTKNRRKRAWAKAKARRRSGWRLVKPGRIMFEMAA